MPVDVVDNDAAGGLGGFNELCQNGFIEKERKGSCGLRGLW